MYYWAPDSLDWEPMNIGFTDFFVWAPDGRVPIGSQLLRIKAAPGSKAILCSHPSGHYSVLAAAPHHKAKPLILFTNLPK